MPESVLRAKEPMAFVPSGKNYERSLRFFQDIGFEVAWKSPEMATLKKDGCKFFLQNYHNQDMQDNFMMNLDVEDLDAWWAKLQAANLEAKYPGVRVKPPTVFPWGKREINIVDPSGVCWHIGVPA
jgi:uncharacterized glyoxalase superfamily protein PhnB